jgi:hypothetical protein
MDSQQILHQSPSQRPGKAMNASTLEMPTRNQGKDLGSHNKSHQHRSNEGFHEGQLETAQVLASAGVRNSKKKLNGTHNAALERM